MKGIPSLLRPRCPAVRAHETKTTGSEKAVNENLKPEERLRLLRARAQAIQSLFEADQNGQPPAETPTERQELQKAREAEPPDSLLKPDHLSLFLRSLSSRLNHAIDEIRASSNDLETLNDEVRRIEQMLGRDH